MMIMIIMLILEDDGENENYGDHDANDDENVVMIKFMMVDIIVLKS